VLWGNFAPGFTDTGCKQAIDVLSEEQKKYTCPTQCHTDIASLINGCDDCAMVHKVCRNELPPDFHIPEREYELKTYLVFGNITYTGSGSIPFDSHGSHNAQMVWDNSSCNDALSEEMEDILQPLKQSFSEHQEGMEFRVDEVHQQAHGIVVWITLKARLGGVGASTPTEFHQTLTDVLMEAIITRSETMLHDHHMVSTNQDWSACTLDVNSSVDALLSDQTIVQHVEGTTFSDLPFRAVPFDRKWQQPYGTGGLLEDMEMWGPEGCRYPFLDYIPETPLCAECGTVVEAVSGFGLWKGPCKHKYDEEWEGVPKSAFPSGFPTQDMSMSASPPQYCSCRCADMLNAVATYCGPNDCISTAYDYAVNANCTIDSIGEVSRIKVELGVVTPAECQKYRGPQLFQSAGDPVRDCLNAAASGQFSSVKAPPQCEAWYGESKRTTGTTTMPKKCTILSEAQMSSMKSRGWEPVMCAK